MPEVTVINGCATRYPQTLVGHVLPAMLGVMRYLSQIFKNTVFAKT
jgi:hypothetical protein